MAARARRGAGSTAATKDGGKEDLQERKVELIREATGAADEDIRLMLAECNNDVNETTSRLIDSRLGASGDGFRWVLQASEHP